MIAYNKGFIATIIYFPLSVTIHEPSMTNIWPEDEFRILKSRWNRPATFFPETILTALFERIIQMSLRFN